MRQVEVRAAISAGDVDVLRVLIREYGAYLANKPAGAANICIAGLERELAGLPGEYVAPGAVLLGWVDGVAVGCVGLRALRPSGLAAEAHAQDGGGLALGVKRLWVRPAGRGVGLGRRLMAAAVDHARGMGARRLYLDTVPAAMPEAKVLYSAMGFEPVGRYNDNGVQGVEFLSLDLGAGRRGDEPAEVTQVRNHTK